MLDLGLLLAGCDWAGASKIQDPRSKIGGFVMTDCCSPTTYGKVFDDREARRNAQSYRQNGLDAVATRMVGFLTAQGVQDSTVLEVGGGIGAIQLELLRAGAARTVNVELSPAYEAVARELLEESGRLDRVQRHVADFAGDPEAFPRVDVVAMHRVVCCYPDMTRLVTGAAGRARRYLAMSYPRDAWWVRAGLVVLNLLYRIRRTGFRTYLHRPQDILATAATQGFRPTMQHRGWVWELTIMEKTDSRRQI